DLHADGRLNNLEGGLVDLAGTTSGNYFYNFGGPGIFNDGLFQLSSAVNANTHSVPFNNAGVVKVLNGSLQISGLTQLQGNTLTGGTWHVMGGASLVLPRTVTTNAATIVLEGEGAALPQLAGLV